MSIEIVEYDSSFLNIDITNDENDENDENESFIMNNNQTVNETLSISSHIHYIMISLLWMLFIKDEVSTFVTFSCM